MNNIKLVNKNSKVLANSREVAEKFNKAHSSVLKNIQGENRNGYHINGLIDELISKNVNVENYFIYSSYENRGKIYPEYLMTRDGFSLLVMGFTGKDVLDWKLKYIEAFNMMESTCYKEKYLCDSNEIYLYRPKSIYVLLANDGSVKIGVSNNVEHRKRTLENYTGKTIQEYYYTPLCSNPFEIESSAHNYFKENRIYGEWFDIDYNDACEYVRDLYDNIATYSYRNKSNDVKCIDEMFEKIHLTDKMNKNNMEIESIKNKLQKYVIKGIIDHIPETYEDAMKMICEQNILYYTKLKDCLSY